MSDHKTGASSCGDVNEAHCSCGWRQRTPTFRDAFAAERDHLHQHGLKTRDEILADRDRVIPFSNGSEFVSWKERNCERCAIGFDGGAFAWRCDLERAMDEASMDDGSMDRELAVRAGVHGVYQRDCPERKPQ